jgi:hypothetical protein
MRFRLKPNQPIEADIQRQVLDYLQHEMARGRVGLICRSNGGGMQDRTGRWLAFYRLWVPGLAPMSRGYGDVHGVLGPGSTTPGRYFLLEVKQPGKPATAEQQAVMQAVTAAGGIAAVVTGFDEVRRVLFGETR